MIQKFIHAALATVFLCAAPTQAAEVRPSLPPSPESLRRSFRELRSFGTAFTLGELGAIGAGYATYRATGGNSERPQNVAMVGGAVATGWVLGSAGGAWLAGSPEGQREPSFSGAVAGASIGLLVGAVAAGVILKTNRDNEMGEFAYFVPLLTVPMGAVAGL